MAVKVAQPWFMHVFALAVAFMAPPTGRRLINTRLVQPALLEGQVQGFDSSNLADGISLLQVGYKVSSGTVGPPTDNSLLGAKTAKVSQQKGEHANVQPTDVAVLQHKKGPFRKGKGGKKHASVYVTDKPAAINVRPNLGGGPEIINFSIYVKNFFGMTLRSNEFTVDVVVTLRWTDPRVSKMVPAGTTNVTISQAEAKENIWMPDIVVANRAIGGQEQISAAVEVYKDGTVVKIERLLLQLKQHFDVSAFPFDYQRPKIMLNSATLMKEDLVLQVMADKASTGAKPGLFGDREFWFLSHNTTVFEEVDGSLRKSRGKFQMTLERDWTRYLQTTILPEIFLILISFTVFWMPRAAPFAMPRVATNLISFLTLMTLSINTTRMLPSDRAGMAWIELFADSMQMQNSLILFLNVFVDWVYFTLDLKELGEKMTHQLAVLFPLMGSVVVLICFTGRSGENLDRMQTLIRLWMFGVQSTWIWHSLRCVREAQQEKEEAKS
mmetsp:Transcript_38125/g.73220  ORF Transcript_38125/g.73220 Transcript_38125/m.73220 type:complete len:496 (+) Transcript_38125:44-1531(+)